jgi:hypothetical protein
MTTGEKLYSLSKITSGTTMQHLKSIDASSGNVMEGDLNYPNVLEPSGKLIFPNRVWIRFIDLFDTFNSYIGKGGYFLKVNSTENGIDVTAVPSETDKNFVFEQDTPLQEWIVTHNMNKYPAVTILDTNEKEIIGEIEYIDENSLAVRFNYNLTGKVICN